MQLKYGDLTNADIELADPESLRLHIRRLQKENATIREKGPDIAGQDLQILDLLDRVGKAVVSELNLERAVQAVTDVATEVTGAQFGAFFYNVLNPDGESYMLYTLSGVDRSAFSKFPMPRNTAVFAPTFNGEGIVRSADIMADPRYGKSEPHYGMPNGHLPVRSYLASPVISRSGEVLGGLFFGHSDVGVFTESSEKLLSAVVSQAAIAIDNSKLFQAAEREIQERKSIEAVLRQKEEQLRLASDFGQVGFWDVNHVTGEVYWDERCRAMFGIFDSRPLTLDDFYKGLHPDDVAMTDLAYAAALNPELREFYDVEYRTVGTEDGIERWVSAKGRGVFDGDGTCLRSLGTVVDITSRKRAEEQLRLATDAGEVGFWDLDHVNGTAFWDERCRALFGVSDTFHVDHSTFQKGLHPDDLDEAMRAFAAAIDPGIRAYYNVEYRTVGLEDRKIRWVQARGRGIFDEDGRCVRSVGTVIDISVRKQAELALRELNETLEGRIAEALESRRLLADIVETTDAFIQVADLNFNWLAINRASADEFERIFGVRPKAGDNMLTILKHLPDHQAAVRAVWQRALAGEEFTDILEFGDSGRDRRAYEMKYNSLRDPSGKLIGAYQFVYDVTERLEAQSRLVEAEEHLRQSQKMEAVGQLTGGIAHDFNNMLAVVMGSIELLDRRYGHGDPRAKRLLDNAAEGAKRAANLTQRLLAFSRQQPLRPARIDVNKLVSGMSDLLRHSLGGEIRLETVLAGGLWPVQADPNQLESVILNLGVNARDAMPSGGHLTIETQNAHLDQRYAGEHMGVPAGQYVLVAVTDTGTGMPPEVIEKAFEPFFTTKAVGKGTGLGLSQVYGFVKQSGGHVKIYSEMGRGTTIKLYLPRDFSVGTSTADETIQGHMETAEPNEVILVVDDEPTVRQFSVDALIELGYRVVGAEGAVQALDLLDMHPEIKLLFTDIAMPDKNGRQLADEARLSRPDLKVLYTTGYTRNAVVHNGVVDAGVELIGKPFTIDELAARVRSMFDSQ